MRRLYNPLRATSNTRYKEILRRRGDEKPPIPFDSVAEYLEIFKILNVFTPVWCRRRGYIHSLYIYLYTYTRQFGTYYY